MKLRFLLFIFAILLGLTQCGGYSYKGKGVKYSKHSKSYPKTNTYSYKKKYYRPYKQGGYKYSKKHGSKYGKKFKYSKRY